MRPLLLASAAVGVLGAASAARAADFAASAEANINTTATDTGGAGDGFTDGSDLVGYWVLATHGNGLWSTESANYYNQGPSAGRWLIGSATGPSARSAALTTGLASIPSFTTSDSALGVSASASSNIARVQSFSETGSDNVVNATDLSNGSLSFGATSSFSGAVNAAPGGAGSRVEFEVWLDPYSANLSSPQLFFLTEIYGGSGAYSWNSATNQLTIDASSEGHVYIEDGTSALEIDTGNSQGLVDYAFATGIFSAISLPAVNSAFDFTLTLPSLDQNWSGSAGTYNQLEVSVDAISIAGVPEPSTWAMMAIGFAGLGFASFRAARKERDPAAATV